MGLGFRRSRARAGSVASGQSRRGRVLAVGAVILAGAFGCGDDGGGDGEGDVAAGPDEVAACLTDGGFSVMREADMDEAQVVGDELKEMLGLIEVVSFDRTEGFGLGTIQFFDDGDSAAEGLDGVRAVRTEEVETGRIGDAVYDYIGDDAAAAVTTVEDCLRG